MNSIFWIATKIFIPSYFQAFVLTAVSAYVLYHTENYLGILIGWFVVGTCMTGMFVIGHECGKGLLMFSPIIVYLNENLS